MQQTAIVPTVQPASFTGDVSDRSGMEGLEIFEDVTMVCCPDLMGAYQAGAIDRDGVKAVQLAMIAHCERMGDRMAILDPLPDLSPQEVKAWRERETNYDSKYAVLYYPWIKVAGPDGHPMAVPPSGHMAGIWARNDNERGVHKAPANEVVTGALEAATPITKGEQDTLNPIGVNCIRSFTGRGLRVWGARTLSSDPAWRYVNVRRLFNYVEKSIEAGTQWVVFEPNDPDLWARVRRDVGAFLTGAWRDGMLFGLTPGEAFFVKCDEELNPPDVRDRGQLVIDVGSGAGQARRVRHLPLPAVLGRRRVGSGAAADRKRRARWQIPRKTRLSQHGSAWNSRVRSPGRSGNARASAARTRSSSTRRAARRASR